MTPQSISLKPAALVWTGFSLIELIIVIGITAILIGVGYPLMKGYQPELQARGGAKRLESLLQRGRVMAINQRRPMRVVVNCALTSGYESCFADLESAVYTEAEVTGWLKLPNERYILNDTLKAVKTKTTTVYDGEDTISGIYWTIFMPNGQAYSDPRPFDLFLYHLAQKGPEMDGWRLTVNNANGRVFLNRENFTPVS
jgi:prepilin-type N-terminal cleavage/methylation domain-containing protein